MWPRSRQCEAAVTMLSHASPATSTCRSLLVFVFPRAVFLVPCILMASFPVHLNDTPLCPSLSPYLLLYHPPYRHPSLISFYSSSVTALRLAADIYNNYFSSSVTASAAGSTSCSVAILPPSVSESLFQLASYSALPHSS